MCVLFGSNDLDGAAPEKVAEIMRRITKVWDEILARRICQQFGKRSDFGEKQEAYVNIQGRLKRARSISKPECRWLGCSYRYKTTRRC